MPLLLQHLLCAQSSEIVQARVICKAVRAYLVLEDIVHAALVTFTLTGKCISFGYGSSQLASANQTFDDRLHSIAAVEGVEFCIPEGYVLGAIC